MTTSEQLDRVARLQSILANISKDIADAARDLADLTMKLEAEARAKSGRPGEVVAAVASVLRLAPSAITGKGRTGAILKARAIVCLILRDAGGMSYPEIGRCFSRDHSTVIHAVRHARQMFETDHPTWTTRPYKAAYAAGVAAWDIDARPVPVDSTVLQAAC